MHIDKQSVTNEYGKPAHTIECIAQLHIRQSSTVIGGGESHSHHVDYNDCIYAMQFGLGKAHINVLLCRILVAFELHFCCI